MRSGSVHLTLFLLCVLTSTVVAQTFLKTISTFAGTGSSAYSGDGGAPTSAAIGVIYRASVDSTNNWVYFCDAGNSRLRVVNKTSNTIHTVAGTSTAGFSGDGMFQFLVIN